ncbi:unnamed protein product [Thlaspi arvense]|uniref:TIR domain-containing protein n=1 Tax=Thlaspi arvense TaxID=13288 RepID=A0AAU9RNL2_THLAR|nr:unnamed protein product [Thlaspi arvense]
MAELRPNHRPPQVFISFNGAEHRDNFIRYLVWGLRSERINVFIDTGEANRREIRNLFTKIEDSNIAVVIFSKRYTESEICLNELQKMHEHAEQNRLVVIPVFYDVSTSDVKNLEGEFGSHFKEMKEKYRNDPLKMLNWEDSLSSISERTGLTSEEHGTGLGLVREIVSAVKNELPNSSGGRINMSKGQVFVLASAAVFLFTLFTARLFCTDVKAYKAVNKDWLRHSHRYMKSVAAKTGFAIATCIFLFGLRFYQQVFISFHGDELRDNFIKYLVWGLRDERVNVFIDRGEANRRDIRNLSTKIEDSNIAVVIFSKMYTESEICLNELQKMHEHAEQNRLVEMREKYINDPLKILNWEDSLSSIAERTGLTSEEHGTGLGLVRAIVSAVKSELPNSSGGRTNMLKGQVFVLASAAVFLFSLFVARFFCTDVKAYKAVKCLLGVPVLVGLLHQLYCL